MLTSLTQTFGNTAPPAGHNSNIVLSSFFCLFPPPPPPDTQPTTSSPSLLQQLHPESVEYVEENVDHPLKRKSPYILRRQTGRSSKSRRPYILKRSAVY